MHLPKHLQLVDLKDFSNVVDSLLKELFVVIAEVKELFKKSLKSCFVFRLKGKTFKELAVCPSIEADTFTTVEVLEVCIEEAMASKKVIAVKMSK